MRRLVRLLGCALALLATLGVGLASAAQQTTLTTVKGVASGTGTFTRTITDISEPGSPGRASVLSIHAINVPWTNGMTPDQFALALQDSCNVVLPVAATGANGYMAVPQNVVQPTVRLAKQLGTYNFVDSPPPSGLTLTTHAPVNAEDAPIESPLGLAALATALAALAYWARRRRMLA